MTVLGFEPREEPVARERADELAVDAALLAGARDRLERLLPDPPGVGDERALLVRQLETRRFRHRRNSSAAVRRGRLPGPAALSMMGRDEEDTMADPPYWNPAHETMPRDELQGLQLRKLRNLVAWADEKVPFHSKRLRDAGVTADSWARSTTSGGSRS